MNTNSNSTEWSWIQLNERRAARMGTLLLLLLALPAVVQAQYDYDYWTGKDTITLYRYTGPGGAVTVPDTINGLPVTDITGTFSLCTNLTAVTTGNSLTNIGRGAFQFCTSLTSVTIGTNVISIGGNAFSGCTSLISITIPASVTRLLGGTFSGCSSLSAINVESSNPAYRSVDGVLFNKSQTSLIECPGAKAGSYTIPNSVTSIVDDAFESCARLTSVVIPNSVTSIGGAAFASCWSLTNVTIGNSVTNIGGFMFYFCTSLTTVTIPSSVTRIEDLAFLGCPSLAAVHFNGNAPSLTGSSVFSGDNNATVYYLPGTTGWGTTFGGRPTVLWDPPVIRTSPQTQTAEVGSAADLRVQASGSSPLFCVWYLNATNLLSCSTNRELALSSVQFSQSGAYTVVVSNALCAVTSAPVMLNVIVPVERRPVPGVKVTGETASLLHVDYADSLSPAPTWATLGSVSLTSTSQYYFDLTVPLPPQRSYRAWQTGTPGVMPSLDLHLVPAITLTGAIGGSVRLDYINQFGPIDAWVTLDTVTLTNTSQLYFDVSASGQRQRLYRLVPLP